MNQVAGQKPASEWRLIIQLGGLAALLTVAVAMVEMVVTFLPGGGAPVETVLEWFTQLQNNPFMALRNLGLLNIIMFTLSIPLNLAVFAVHRRVEPSLAALALLISSIGLAIFFATNRAFSMLELSRLFAGAAGEEQRQAILAAGQAMLAVGRSHSPGTFIAFAFGEAAGILMSVVMLRGQLLGKAAPWMGIAGFSSLLIYEIGVSFFPESVSLMMLFAIVGGLLNIAWLVLVGRGLLRLARSAQ